MWNNFQFKQPKKKGTRNRFAHVCFTISLSIPDIVHYFLLKFFSFFVPNFDFSCIVLYLYIYNLYAVSRMLYAVCCRCVPFYRCWFICDSNGIAGLFSLYHWQFDVNLRFMCGYIEKQHTWRMLNVKCTKYQGWSNIQISLKMVEMQTFMPDINREACARACWQRKKGTSEREEEKEI